MSKKEISTEVTEEKKVKNIKWFVFFFMEIKSYQIIQNNLCAIIPVPKTKNRGIIELVY